MHKSIMCRHCSSWSLQVRTFILYFLSASFAYICSSLSITWYFYASLLLITFYFFSVLRYQGGDNFIPKHKEAEIFPEKDLFKWKCYTSGINPDTNVTMYFAPDDSHTSELMGKVIKSQQILYNKHCSIRNTESWRKYEMNIYLIVRIIIVSYS